MSKKRSLIAQATILTAHGQSAANDNIHSNPCLSCGACCAHFRVSFYCGEIAGEDGNGVPSELVSQAGPLRACMKGTENGGQRCVALGGEIGKEGVHCTIYVQRPSPCRDFPAWETDGTPSPDCQKARARFGLPALPHIGEDDDIDPGSTPSHRDSEAA